MNFYTRVLEDEAEQIQQTLANLDTIAAKLLAHNPRYATALKKRRNFHDERYAELRLQIDSAEIFGS